MYRVAVVELRLSLFEFWYMAPRKLIMLIDETKKAEREAMKAQAYYTACMVWGQEIEEDEKGRKGIPGIDYPAGEGATGWLHK